MSYEKILGSFSERGILYRIYKDSVTVSKKVVFLKKIARRRHCRVAIYMNLASFVTYEL